MISAQDLELMNADDPNSPVFRRWLEKMITQHQIILSGEKETETSLGYLSTKQKLIFFLSKVEVLDSLSSSDFRPIIQNVISFLDDLQSHPVVRIKDGLDFLCWRLIRSWVAGVEMGNSLSQIKFWQTENPLMAGKNTWDRIMLFFDPNVYRSLHRTKCRLEVKIQSQWFQGASFLKVNVSQGKFIVGFSPYLIAIWIAVKGDIFNEMQQECQVIDVVNAHGYFSLSLFGREWRWACVDWPMKRGFKTYFVEERQASFSMGGREVTAQIKIEFCLQSRLWFSQKHFLKTTVCFPPESGDDIVFYDILPALDTRTLGEKVSEELELRSKIKFFPDSPF